MYPVFRGKHMKIINSRQQSEAGKGAPSLIRGVLVRIFILSFCVVLLFTAIAYYTTYESYKKKNLEELRSNVMERVRTDSEIFKLAQDDLKIFEEEFLKLYLSDIEVTGEEFWSYYDVDEEGATRMKRVYFDGIFDRAGNYVYGMSSFIGNNQSVDDPDLQRRLLLAYRVLYRLGPAWANRFPNVTAAFPENASVLFYPEEPWGLNAAADLPMNELGVIRSAGVKENPEREPIWSGLYYDETAEKWVITHMRPVDYNGRHLITPGHDIYLSELVDRLTADRGDGTYDFIIREDGYLVAHPSNPSDEQKLVGELSLDKIAIPSVKEAYRLIKEEGLSNFDEVKVIENQAFRSYLAVGRLEGPGWLFVRVFPMEIIGASAHRTAGNAFAGGIAILLVILIIVRYVMRYQAEKPLEQLSRAAEYIGKGKYKEIAERKIPLPMDLKNEIGMLSVRFVEMAANIDEARNNLERIVQERTRALEKANASLKEMSLLDGLTGIHNRRAFDRNLAGVFQDARAGLGTFSLMMLDIDFFKNYNDIYGHSEGDKALKMVAETLAGMVRREDRAFRYGGEEFAILFSQADLDVAEELASRILESIRDLKLEHRESPAGILTISGGIAAYDVRFTDPEEMIKVADERLYKAKHAGRNTYAVK